MQNTHKGAQMKLNNSTQEKTALIVRQSKIILTSHYKTIFQVIVTALIVSSCTKNRAVELPEDTAPNVYEISMFGAPNENSSFSVNAADVAVKSDNDLQILNLNQTTPLSTDEVNVPDRIKFMFDQLPMISQTANQFKITFTVDKKNVTAYKIANNISELNAIEKSIAISAKEAVLITKASRTQKSELKSLAIEQKNAAIEREQIKSGKAVGKLFVPMFKYEISSYGKIERIKNELKEETAVLKLKETDWSQATHIQIKSMTDSRKVIGVDANQPKMMSQLFKTEKIDNRITTAGALSEELKIGLKFLNPKTQVLTKLSANSLLIYEITDTTKLSAEQNRILKSGGSGGQIISCSDAEIKAVVKSTNPNCAVVLVATTAVAYKKLDLVLTDASGTTGSSLVATDVPKSQNLGLVEILENSVTVQKEVTGILDPDSSIQISDIQGEFLFRRTFEDAATSFLGRTGTSGDMAIVKFELENDRLVVRNQLSLIQYTGQGAKDREEILSVPVRYFYVSKNDANGSDLILGSLVETTKEKATHVKLDWTQNTIPDASSPLAFFDAGSCFIANSSKKVTNTDMRLAKEGILNFSISSSHTVDYNCRTQKEVNSAYWAGSQQMNFNVVERISFVKHTNKDKTDTQFSMNISPMAQESFNFGVFTLADKVNDNGKLDNRDGSEKYLPMIHDLRNGKMMKWYLGGINDATATNQERRQLLINSAKQVVAEWNRTFAYSMKGTPLQRSGDYIELVIEDAGKETGKLGDLNRNYIWFNEIPADNGLLGVAQPAANPRSGVIESANVIVYTGNTHEQTKILLKTTEVSRNYEKAIEALKTQTLDKAKLTQKPVSSKDEATKSENKDAHQNTIQKTAQLTSKNKTYLTSLVKYFELENKDIKNAISGMKMGQSAESLKRILSKETFRNGLLATKVELPTNAMTLTKKMTELSMNKKISQNERLLELEMNNLFIAHGGLSDDVKSILSKRQQMLSLSTQFDKATEKRAGCFQYARNDINDRALDYGIDRTVAEKDKTPEQKAAERKLNFDMNFKMAVMSTLSHELGHAFGLLHNFKASTDKANYEFPGEKPTGRNYSSIMDYISDIDQEYAGPGPYDAHALRAAYTGYVEFSEEAILSTEVLEKLKEKSIKLINGNLIHINDILKFRNSASLVHYTKETLNKIGLTKFYEQCSDGGRSTSILCNQFDTGGSATEIVKNMIADYTRSYANRNYVYDKITFGWSEKVQLITRNIRTFSQIRAYLDETLMAAQYGAGRTPEIDAKILEDLKNASLEGYRFFHELIRTPDAGVSFSKIAARFQAVPYQYGVLSEDQKTKSVKKDYKIIEGRSLYDLGLRGSKDKFDTVGIAYDKNFAMNFLMQTSTVFGPDSSEQGYISYKDFEQFFLGVENPKDSLTINTMIEILTNNLKVGFFAPNGELINLNASVDINRMLGDQTAVAAIIGLYESKWKSFDAFAESFKMARSTAKNAPKDRLNVTRLGQDRSKSDTTVFYATQNGVAANVLIQQAARGDILLSNKTELFKQLDELMTADSAYMNKINADRDSACVTSDDGKVKDKDACDKAYTKTIQEYLKDDANLIAAKQKADLIAKKLALEFRKLNQNGAILDLALDKPESKANFENQVEVIRTLNTAQMHLLSLLKATLEKAPVDKLAETVTMVLETVKQTRTSNDQLAALPLIAYSQSYLVEASKKVSINLKDGSNVNGIALMSQMMDGKNIERGNEKIVDIIDKLTQFSRYVDLDLETTK